MANTKSAQKKVRQSARRHTINLARRTAVKTVVKKILTAIANGEKIEVVKDFMRDAESQISRAKNKILHKNSASRKVSRLAIRVANYEKSLSSQS